jgi:peptidyl-prolyl cis-trans isomerase C
MTKRILHEPLTHFLLMAALIFAAHAWRSKDDNDDTPQDRIEVTAGTLSWLKEGFAKQWSRAPDETELRGLVDNHIREEVLYREALELGLDRNDTIVRRRMAQKMEFLSQDIAASVEPDEVTLREFFTESAARYAMAPRISFRHVYFSKERRGDKLDGDAKAALEALTNGANEESMGDPSLIPHEFENADPKEIAATFGDHFAAGLTAIPQGGWRGPVASSYGLHLILVSGRSEPETVAFETVRDAVMRDVVEARRQQANLDFIDRLKQRYEIKVDEAALKETAARSGATAVR